jgi:hypothetical protein
MFCKFKKEDINLKIIKNPLMIGPNKWWYVIEDENGYIIDKQCTSRQYFKIYKHKTGDNSLKFDEFLAKAKSGEIDLKQI